ncbi:MAG: hypothetical protein RIT45_1371 [Pseudomonadota bacterium]|jgi:DMSO/TMAO reductase YedYZ molybdopterin-dependent catalytic subunit
MQGDDVNRGLPAGVDPARVAARVRGVARLAARAQPGSDARLPAGQTAVRKWPRLDLGVLPEVDPATFVLVVDGACRNPLRLGPTELAAFPQVRGRQDFHCVTGWSRLDLDLAGVRVADVLAAADPLPDARFVLARGADGYSTNLTLADCLAPDVLLVTQWEGAPLPIEHGGPLRMVTPHLWAWKGTKWIVRLQLRQREQRGFWERRGYSNSADPFRGERFEGGVPPETYAVEVPEDAEPYSLSVERREPPGDDDEEDR